MKAFFFPLMRSSVAIAFLVAMIPGLLRAAENEVVVVSPHWDGIKEETSRAFSAWHQKTYGRPATIRWRDAGGGGSQIIRFLRSEYQASPNVGIDVLYGGGVDPFQELEKDGLLTPYDPPPDVLAHLAPSINGVVAFDPKHEWFGAAVSGFGILTNERARAALNLPAAHTWEDLANPRLAGWISGIDPRASSSVLQIYEIILQAYGWDKGWAVLMEMSGNIRHYLPSAAASAVEVGVGDAVYGLAIDVYGNAQAGFYGSDNVSFILPEGQTVITPDAIAILKNPPHPKMARHLMEFVLSRDGQLLWMLPKGAPGGATRYAINRMCVWPSLYPELAGKTSISTNPFEAKSTFVYSNQLGSSRRAILSILIASWMIDTHDTLTQAWKALNSPAALKLAPERRQALLDQFLTPPCTQDELLQLTKTDWVSPTKRTALVNLWQNKSQALYKKLLAELSQG